MNIFSAFDTGVMAAFKLDEEIACYCSDEEIQKLADEELVEIIYEWQRL